MARRQRIYDSMLEEHFARNRQMAFVSGPRQVGKTTTCKAHADFYLNWDSEDDRERVLAGAATLAEDLKTSRLSARKPSVLFDELHRYSRWKQFLKGFYDVYGERLQIVVTGSSRLEIYKRGGDSLMGRYFPFRMHPFSVAETLHKDLPDPDAVIRQPKKPRAADFEALWVHGGYPEPFLKRDARFSRRWQTLRTEQLVREDVRDLTRIQQLDQLQSLVRVLVDRSSQQLVYSSLAKQVRITVDTARRWVDILQSLHLGFLVRPWYKNVSRSLRKEPKWFLRDWAAIEDPGARAETFVACHLLKAVDGWNDMGLGRFELGYLRNKEKMEVDFIVARDGAPWFLVEVKQSDERVSKALRSFQAELRPPHAFQVVVDADYVDRDCFAQGAEPLVVPLRTLLSQLL